VVAFDQRGHGESGKPASGYGFERLAADAHSVIRRLDLDHPILVGHSWGANVALEVSVRDRGGVSGLVLTDGGFHNLADEFDWRTAREAMTPPPLTGMHSEAFLEVARARMKGKFVWTSAHDEIVLSLMRIDREGRIRPRLSLRNHLKIIRAMWEQDTVALLRRLRVPTLLMLTRLRGEIPGEQTAVWTEVKRRAAAEIRRMNGPVRVEWIQGIHDVPIQAPQRVARRILRFVAEVVPA
jgi:pimeloyl-ACP methyl ester carboxylesterase